MAKSVKLLSNNSKKHQNKENTLHFDEKIRFFPVFCSDLRKSKSEKKLSNQNLVTNCKQTCDLPFKKANWQDLKASKIAESHENWRYD